MKICLDLHDWSLSHNRLDLIFELKRRFPNFKVSLFTIPNDIKSDYGSYLIKEEIVNRVRENLDWIQLIPHGLNHNGREMARCDYPTFKDQIIPAIEEAFGKNKLRFEKGFCAPHWKWSEGVVQALDWLGWWGAIDKRQPNMLSTKRFYRYSHCIDEEFPLDTETLKLHGHVYGTRNDLGRCMKNLLKLPISAKWHFVTDFLEDYAH